MTAVDFGSIIKNSIRLTWRNKWLWVYGLVIAGLSGSSTGFSVPQNLPKDLPAQEQKNIGQAVGWVTQWLAGVPLQTWILLGLGVLLVIILGMIVNWIALSWAKGSLIGGLVDADGNKDTGLSKTTGYGLKSIKNLILFSLLSGSIALGIIIVLTLVVGLTALVSTFWLFLTGGVAVLALIPIMIILAMVDVYGTRLIVLENYSPGRAWKKGLSLSRSNFLNTFLMGIIHSAIGFASVIAVVVVIVISAHSIGGLITLGVVALALNIVLRAAFIVFTYSNWNQLFKQIYEK